MNAALRRIVTSDQRALARPAGRAARKASSKMRGAYATEVDAGMVSASTVVVCVLMPAVYLFPGGTGGAILVSGTVLVPSGRRIGLAQLFKRPASALPVLAREFKQAFPRQDPSRGGCLDWVPLALRPTAHNYRHVVPLPAGLTVGLDGYSNCQRLIATVPYARLRPYFSHLGAS